MKADWQEAETQRKAARQDQKLIQEQAQQVRLIRQRLDRIGKDANNVLEGHHRHLSPTPCAVTEATIGALEEDVDKLSALRTKVHDHLRKLLAINILTNMDSQSHISAFTSEHVEGFHNQMKAVYDNLDTQEANYRHQVERHNKTTHTQVEILRTAKEQVSAFMRRINAEMDQFSISDLEAVRVDVPASPALPATAGRPRQGRPAQRRTAGPPRLQPAQGIPGRLLQQGRPTHRHPAQPRQDSGASHLQLS